MERRQVSQGLVGDDVPVQHRNRFFAVGDFGEPRFDGPAAAQGGIFDAVLGADAEGLAVAEMVLDGLPAVTGQKNNIGHSTGFQPFHLVFQDGLAADGDHGFGQGIGQRAESFTLPAGQNQRIHAV